MCSVMEAASQPGTTRHSKTHVSKEESSDRMAALSTQGSRAEGSSWSSELGLVVVVVGASSDGRRCHMRAGGWLCRDHVGASTGGGVGLEEAAWLDGLHICLNWWMRLPGGFPWGPQPP